MLKRAIRRAEHYRSLFFSSLEKTYTQMIESYHTTISKLKDLAATNYMLGLDHIKAGNYNDARLRFWIVSLIDKTRYPRIYYYMARIYWLKRSVNKAKLALEKAKELLPADDAELHFLDTRIHSPSMISSIPLSIIEENFDVSADAYEPIYLEELHYKGHTILAKELRHIVRNITHSRIDILDIGCGTGLVGRALAPYDIARFLDGVDISRNMLNHSSKLVFNEESVYHSTAHQDILSYLDKAPQLYNAITACHVLHYFGDLDALFTHAHRRLNEWGVFAFTVGYSPTVQEGYAIDDNVDHFYHAPTYIDALIEKHKWTTLTSGSFIMMDNSPAVLYIIQRGENHH